MSDIYTPHHCEVCGLAPACAQNFGLCERGQAVSDDVTTANPDRGEVLSLMETLKAMTEIAQLSKPVEVDP